MLLRFLFCRAMVASMARTKPLEPDVPVGFARGMLDQIIAKHDPKASRELGKNPHAVAVGNRGGSKGGHARAKNLSAKKRQSIAKKTANTRWKKS
jgi:hypothetical protein